MTVRKLFSFVLRYLRLRKLDNLVRRSLDQILPVNLSARYILGLSAIAFLTVFGQILIQTTLQKQLKTNDSLRALDHQIPLIEELRKTALSLQLSSSSSESKKLKEYINNLISQLNKSNNAALELHRNSKSHEIRLSLTILDNSLKTISESGLIMSQKTNGRSNFQTAKLAKEILDASSIYQTELKHEIHSYEEQVQFYVSSFKKTEFFLLLTTLLVLLLEALYVFRPSVQRLYEALRIRSDFLSRMSHELRNPMNSIIGMANLLSETSVTPQQKNYLSVLQRSSNALLELLNGLLDFSSFETGNIKLDKIEFNLHDVLEKSLDLVVISAQSNGTELILDLSPKTPLSLLGDPVRLQQAVYNLLGNAVKFTQGGEVLLRVEPIHENSPVKIRFSIIDTGIGIDPEKLAQIFDPFVQEDNSIRRRFGGSGLGLTITKDLVSKMGGKLEVQTEKGKGSTFSFILSFEIANNSTELSGYETLLPPSSTATMNAFIIEKNNTVFSVIKTLLENKNIKVNQISAKDLLDITDATQNPVIIIYDFDQISPFLPELEEKLSSQVWNRALFLLKTTNSTSDIERLVGLGSKNLIFKPIKPLQLYEAIRNVIFEKPDSSLEEQAEQKKNADKTPYFSKAPKILVVDDSKDNQVLFLAYLQPLNCVVTVADNGWDAVEKYKQDHFDIVLMDIQMPELDGYGAVQMIRSWEREKGIPKKPIIGVSAYNMGERAKISGFSAYLVKPVSARELKRSILEFMPKSNSSSITETDPVKLLEAKMKELAPGYIENRTKEIIELRKFFSNSEFNEIERIGHRLKGNAVSYGFPILSRIGSDLEAAIQNNEKNKISGLLDEIQSFLDKNKTKS